MSELALHTCDVCGGDGGGCDYAGFWHECRACDGEGLVFRELEPVEMAETDFAWGAMWERWAEDIAAQIGGC